MRETLLLVFAGLFVGLLCTLASTRLLAHMLFGLSANDPLVLLIVSIIMILVGAFAGYLPARRAMHTDPLIALRSE